MAKDFVMEYRNPIFLQDGRIDCEINHEKFGWIPFTCDPSDAGALFDTAALFEKMKPHAAPYSPPPPLTDEEVAAEIRDRRNQFLSETDWIVIKAYERNENIPAEWEIYRQALRDITTQTGFPHDVIWPTKPN